MDQQDFAQSREDDDLFGDEFEAVVEPTPSYQGGRDQGGRGSQGGARHSQRGASPSKSKGLAASAYADSKSSEPQAALHTASEPQVTAATTIPHEPTPPTESRIPAVRGDRSATGGPAHKKLTEEELTAKMAKMAILNAQKSERHRASEADQAAFQHREKELAKERKEKAIAEKRNERVMDMERAKNRERKIRASAGREWDSEKQESDIVDGKNKSRSSEYVRGGHGGVMRGGGGLGASRYASEDARESDYTPQYRSERGNRGARGGRGGGRGGRGGRGGMTAMTTVPMAEDFPSLPTAPKTTTPSTTPATTMEAPSAQPAEIPTTEGILSPMAEKGQHDWAEEMATPVAEVKEAGIDS